MASDVAKVRAVPGAERSDSMRADICCAGGHRRRPRSIITIWYAKKAIGKLRNRSSPSELPVARNRYPPDFDASDEGARDQRRGDFPGNW